VRIIENILAKKEQIIQKAELLKAIAHPIRLCIVNGLINQPGCNVSMIIGCLNVPQSTVSQHLAKLKSAGIVEGRRDGLEVYYYVTNEKIIKVVQDLID
jgi:DNA-binding transcriptional ArsR family regulator